jgi:hypothetical protein
MAMKNRICFIMLLSLLIPAIKAQEISEKDNSLLDNFIKSRVIINKKMMVSDTLSKVFSATFYRIDAGFAFLEDESSSCSGDLFVIREGEPLALGSRTDSMPTLLSLVRKDFFLKGETEAKIFEKALDALFPLSEFREKYREHFKRGNVWYFIRDQFFDSKSGYMITVDQKSNIVNISYSMEAIKK